MAKTPLSLMEQDQYEREIERLCAEQRRLAADFADRLKRSGALRNLAYHLDGVRREMLGVAHRSVVSVDAVTLARAFDLDRASLLLHRLAFAEEERAEEHARRVRKDDEQKEIEARAGRLAHDRKRHNKPKGRSR